MRVLCLFNMKQYQVTGMSCAACQARVEKAVSKIPGVTECAVSLLTNSMGVDGDVDPSEIIAAVEKAGYEAKLKGGETGDGTATREDSISAAEDALTDRETPILKKRLVSSLGFLAVLMYFSMGHMMLGFPIPGFFDGNHVAMGIVQMILSAVIMIINKKFFTSGFKSLVHFAPNMDTLVAMGSMVSFCWSTAVLLKMTGDVLRGDDRAVMADMDSFYFEAAAMIVTLITVGKMLEAMSKGRTTDALKGLMKLAPRTAVIMVSGEEKIVPIDQVKKGDIFVVRPGENIPVDGVITEGSTAVDESALTGESIPVDKTEGDAVSAATLNREGFIKGEVTGAGDDTTLSQIIRMVSDAAATKAPIAKIADRISGIFVPAVLIIAAAVTTIWILAGQEVGYSLARGISVLVISCPCALGLATPVAIMVGSGKGAVNGILFKTAESLEETGRIRIVALDKTGTVTKGEPEVTDIMAAEPFSREELLKLAYSLEVRSEHPLAKAVLAKAREEDLKAGEISEFSVSPGNGLQGRLGDDVLRGGNLKFIKETVSVDLPEEAVVTADELAMDGKTCLYFAKNGEFVGIIAVADTIKEDSPEAIAQLHNMGIKVVMITGDNEKTAKAIGREAGVDDVVAGVLPEGKAEEIERLQQYGKVAMVGDGINDAPALTRADIGIAIGAGTDVAIDAADVVLMNSKLGDVTAALRLSRRTVKNIHENLFWAFIYNIILIPVAAGAYVHLTGWSMNPMLGAAAMSLSSFCVVMNALRLNLSDIHSGKNDRKNEPGLNLSDIRSEKNDREDEPGLNLSDIHSDRNDRKTEIVKGEKEKNMMKKKLDIEGMMCGHCEATVKKALEALDGVDVADVSHEKDEAVVSLDKEVSDETLKDAVEEKDYKVTAVTKQ